MGARKTTRTKGPLEIANVAAAHDRMRRRQAEDIRRDERMLWGVAAAAGLAGGLDTEQAQAAADDIAGGWRKRYGDPDVDPDGS